MHSPRFFPDVSRPDVRPALSAWQKEWDSLRGEIEILRYTSVKHPCGAPIHVMVDKSASLTREATLGGVLFINGQTYGLTVAHAFLPSIQAPEISSESETNDEFCFDDDDDEGNSEMNTRAVLYTAQKEMESFRRTQYKDQRAERSATSSKPTVYPLATSSAFGTLQKGPTTNLGRLCKASTGHGGGLDWAVILIGDEQYRKSNVIRTPEVIIIDEVASDSPKDVKVLAVTPHGHIRGSISGTPYYLKISGSGCFEECWTACLDETISMGDCGSWVIDAQTEEWIGHIVARQPGSTLAYIVPAQRIMEDIKAEFGHEPSLFPTSTDQIEDRKIAHD